jgi:hypothetical protein
MVRSVTVHLAPKPDSESILKPDRNQDKSAPHTRASSGLATGITLGPLFDGKPFVFSPTGSASLSALGWSPRAAAAFLHPNRHEREPLRESILRSFNRNGSPSLFAVRTKTLNVKTNLSRGKKAGWQQSSADSQSCLGR